MKKACLIVFAICSFIRHTSAQKNLPIGVFDSGTGGLTVMQAMLTLDAFNNKTGKPGSDGKPDFQNEAYQYLADQANMPYGNYAAENKTDLLKEHIMKNMNFFLETSYQIKNDNNWGTQKKLPVKMIVIACNTATAYALSDIKNYVQQQGKNIPVIGVIDAGAKAALQYQQTHTAGTIGVFATAGTVASNGYPRTLESFARQMNLAVPQIVSQGGVGLAESIDRDWSYFSDTLTAIRNSYKGPSIKNSKLIIDTLLLAAYNFDKIGNKLLCEMDGSKCIDMQLNDPANYVRYHLVSLLEKMKMQHYNLPLNTLILGCTHYPYMKDTIAHVLNELYNYKVNGAYRYRDVLAEQVELIDPAVETAKDAYVAMRMQMLEQKKKSKSNSNTFFISVPNTSLPGVQLQDDGWFTYAYKYGRNAGENKEYVKYVPFDTHNVSAATYNRFKSVLPNVYASLIVKVQGLQ